MRTLTPSKLVSGTFAGDVVQEDDVIAQIETDKVTIDVKFTGKSGKITGLAVGEGDTVVVGQKVADFEEGDFGGGGSKPAAAPEPAAEAAPPPPKQQPAAAAPAPPSPPPTPKQQAAPAPKVGRDSEPPGC
jgi:2-oxoglutarate dehydrogenase E2 component (dihydrolipoamide succinyltransferase)